MLKKRWLILGSSLCICVAFALIWFFQKPQSKPSSPPIPHRLKAKFFETTKINKYTSYKVPCINIQLEDKIYLAKLDLGFGGDTDLHLRLTSEILNSLEQKKYLHTTSSYGIRGKEYTSNLFRIPNVKIGNLTFRNLKVKELNHEFNKDGMFILNEEISTEKDEEIPIDKEISAIGWKLFYNANLLLDFEKSILVCCDSLETLRDNGYPIDSFLEIPLLLDHGLIEFEANIDKGPIRCILDTGATWNIINSDSNEMTPFFSTLRIGNINFGMTKFYEQSLKVPIKLDAIIGMEFLESKLVFIDFNNKKIYFYEKEKQSKDIEEGISYPYPFFYDSTDSFSVEDTAKHESKKDSSKNESPSARHAPLGKGTLTVDAENTDFLSQCEAKWDKIQEKNKPVKKKKSRLKDNEDEKEKKDHSPRVTFKWSTEK